MYMSRCWMRSPPNYPGLWSLFLVRASVVNIINQAISSRRQDLGLNRLVDYIPYTLQTLECGGGEWRLAVVYWISLRKPISIDSFLEWQDRTSLAKCGITSRQSFLCLPIYSLCNRSLLLQHLKQFRLGKQIKQNPRPKCLDQINSPWISVNFKLNFSLERTLKKFQPFHVIW